MPCCASSAVPGRASLRLCMGPELVSQIPCSKEGCGFLSSSQTKDKGLTSVLPLQCCEAVIPARIPIFVALLSLKAPSLLLLELIFFFLFQEMLTNSKVFSVGMDSNFWSK